MKALHLFSCVVFGVFTHCLFAGTYDEGDAAAEVSVYDASATHDGSTDSDSDSASDYDSSLAPSEGVTVTFSQSLIVSEGAGPKQKPGASH